MTQSMLIPVRERAALAWVAAVAGPVESSQALGVVGASWLLRFAGSEPLSLRLGDPGDESMCRRFRCEAEALVLAEGSPILAPRLVAADLDGSSSGRLALLRTMLPGTSQIPEKPSPARLRSLGAAAAAVASIAVPRSADLPSRTRPIAEAANVVQASSAGAALRLAEAAERIKGWQDRSGEHVLVHGDFWQGNTLWADGRLSGVVDWDCAGFGPAGIDLGYMRLDAVLTYGVKAADQVLEGWERARGRRARDVAYWDVVAAVATPPNLGEWVSAWHGQGRLDVDSPTVTKRRDDFLRLALRDLG